MRCLPPPAPPPPARPSPPQHPPAPSCRSQTRSAVRDKAPSSTAWLRKALILCCQSTENPDWKPKFLLLPTVVRFCDCMSTGDVVKLQHRILFCPDLVLERHILFLITAILNVILPFVVISPVSLPCLTVCACVNSQITFFTIVIFPQT